MSAKKEKKPYVKRTDFLEPFEKSEKIKGGIAFGVYVILTVFGGSLLIRTGVPLIQENMTFWVYLAEFILVAALFGKMYFRSFRDIKEKDIADVIVILAVSLVVMVAAAIFLSMGLGIESSNQQGIEGDMEKGGIVKILMTVAAVFFAPIVEETSYRFFLFRLIRGNGGWVRRTTAHILVAALFAFSHCWGDVIINKDFSQLLAVMPLFIIGLSFSIMYDKNKNIALSVLMHMTVNFIAST
ncbi:MAG: CPBP family intramembrane metalloprotease [Ruminococcus sp.]|nr:CPBP family intramembrane metalloprotease [Ruminococcus sp.]MCM1382421.1 CPBP family intramembrane metalloprotease [Muribaculaceae bacterium]